MKYDYNSVASSHKGLALGKHSVYMTGTEPATMPFVLLYIYSWSIARRADMHLIGCTSVMFVHVL